jgi:hypothetical protein
MRSRKHAQLKLSSDTCYIGNSIVKRLIFMTLESGTVTVALAAGYLAIAFNKADPAGLTSIVRIQNVIRSVSRTDKITLLYRPPAPPEHTT